MGYRWRGRPPSLTFALPDVTGLAVSVHLYARASAIAAFLATGASKQEGAETTIKEVLAAVPAGAVGVGTAGDRPRGLPTDHVNRIATRQGQCDE